MQVNKLIETADGGVTFQGVLDPIEVEFLIEVALGVLYEKGALPFLKAEDAGANLVLPGVYTEQ